MTDVENCEILTIVEKFIISPHDRCKKLKSTLFCCQISWLAVYAVLPWNLFCRDLRAFCVEKNCSQKCAMWRKNDKYDVCINVKKLKLKAYWHLTPPGDPIQIRWIQSTHPTMIIHLRCFWEEYTPLLLRQHPYHGPHAFYPFTPSPSFIDHPLHQPCLSCLHADLEPGWHKVWTVFPKVL